MMTMQMTIVVNTGVWYAYPLGLTHGLGLDMGERMNCFLI